MTRTPWDDLYARITVSPDARPVAGYYNLNYVDVVDEQRVVLRVPIADAPEMNLRLLSEHVVLRRAGELKLRVPRVLAVSPRPRFQVHEYISGVRLDELAPRGVTMPRGLVDELATFFATLWRAPQTDLHVPADWPISGDTPGFFDRLVAHVQHIHNCTRGEYGALFHALGIPLEPLAEARARKAELRSRPFTLIHCDVHRKNCIVNNQRLWYLDW